MPTATKTRKPRKAPQAVHGVARWIGGNPTQERLDDGNTILQITVEGQEPAFYFVTTNKDGEKVVGYRLTKIDALEKTESYDVDAQTWECCCADATYTDRPGGCKHAKSMRAALAAAKLL